MRGAMKARKCYRQGQGTTELALLLPALAALFFGAVQVVIFLQSSTMTQYASFVSARAFQVYGDRTLEEINYQKLASAPFTNKDQTIAEAAAEAVIFESLLWEQRRIDVQDTINFLNRVYEDGNNVTYSGFPVENTPGVVQVNFRCSSAGCEDGTGVDVSYCMPIVFPGIEFFFEAVKEESPCETIQAGRSYSGVMITKRTEFGREPVEP